MKPRHRRTTDIAKAVGVHPNTTSLYEDIVYATDRLLSILAGQEQRAQDMIAQLQGMMARRG